MEGNDGGDLLLFFGAIYSVVGPFFEDYDGLMLCVGHERAVSVVWLVLVGGWAKEELCH